MRTYENLIRRFLRPAAAAAALLLLIPAAGQADDRRLLRESVGNPYVFILFDTSGSMHKSPRCTLEDFNRPVGDTAKCDFLCPTGDCFVPRNGDDPASKFYQAKEALYEVLSNVDDVHFGFATYNQDNLHVRGKHWLYRVASTQPHADGFFTLDDNTSFPIAGAEHNFGRTWSCYAGFGPGDIDEIGCDEDTPADLDEPYDLQRSWRYPKLGSSGTFNRDYYIRDSGGTKYRVFVRRLSESSTSGQSLGDATLDILYYVQRCRNGDCDDRENITGSPHEIRFDLVGEFQSWDANPLKDTDPDKAFFSQTASEDSDAGDTCDGWDPVNGGSSDDDVYYGGGTGYRTRFPTDTSDTRGSLFYEGDVIPLDWLDDHKAEVLCRFAPNTCTDPSATPDFRVASYYTDNIPSGYVQHILHDEDERPLLAAGSTPLGASVEDFREWYAGCGTGTCSGSGGWSNAASSNDPDWGCRRKYLLVITDGDETCDGDPCARTGELFSEDGVKTFVVAFGVESTTENKLDCMADQGGTGEPIYPSNKNELVAALSAIFGEIREESRTFASAAVPSVQAEVSDKIYLSNFTPLNGKSFWDGHVDAYLKPLPLTDDNRPDESRQCSATVRSSCHLWDAGDELVQQAPSASDLAMVDVEDNNETLTPTHLKLDLTTSATGVPNGRRVFYGLQQLTDGVPSTSRLFTPSTTLSYQIDHWLGFDVFPSDPLDTNEVNDSNQRVQEVIRDTLKIKEATIETPDGTLEDIEYVLGDIFHSDPVLISNPGNFGYYNKDLFTEFDNSGNLKPCDGNDPNPGYRCYAERNRWRRKMLVVGANDGQLHFFDSGYFEAGNPNPITGRFNDGTGRELFSYIPRLALPILEEQTAGTAQIYSLDATIAVDDAYLDPAHNGTPTAGEREWRTVLVGGLRAGGSVYEAGFLDESDGFVSGYYALDVTQPDLLDTETFDGVESYLPSESVVPTCMDFGTADDYLLDAPAAGTADYGCQLLRQASSADQPRAFPTELWTFTDEFRIASATYAFDEEDTDGDGDRDGNNERDLAHTWSVPVITQVEVCTTNCDPANSNNDIERRFVAIFGGGLDTLNKGNPQRGTWVYMVDIESGKAIYKRQVVGDVPADPAVVDEDLDGIADRIYIATTAGWIYKIDLSEPGLISSETFAKELFIPEPATDQTITRVFDPAWEPFPIFSTDGRPVYFTPTAFFIAEQGTFGLAFGTGDREDLWQEDGVEGRYYFIVDNEFEALDVTMGTLPLDESDFVIVDSTGGAVGDSDNFIINPPPGKQAGWVMTLATNERVLSQAFGLTGILIFSTYNPQTIVVSSSTGTGSGDTVCARTGDSRIFLVLLTNANPLIGTDAEDRFRVVPEFVTAPYVEQGQTQNSPTGGIKNTEQLSPEQLAIFEKLKEFFPENTRFTNAWLSVSASRSDTGYERYATIPVGLVVSRWKEQ